MWNERSKFGSSIQTGRASASGGKTTFCRNRGTRCRRDAMTVWSSPKRNRPSGAVAGSRIASPPTWLWFEGVSRYRNEASCGPSRSTIRPLRSGRPRIAGSAPDDEPGRGIVRSSSEGSAGGVKRPASKRLLAAAGIAWVAMLLVPPAFARAASYEASGASGRTESVSEIDNLFDPSTPHVAVGSTVGWTNDGRSPHTVTADDGSFDSGNQAPGAAFTFTFARPGAYRYYCRYHGGPGGLGMRS